MNITSESAERLQELVQIMQESLDEFKHICKTAMTSSEYQQFKYRTLGHIEPALFEDSEWVTSYSSIDSLEKVANNASAIEEMCKECDGPLDEDGFCEDVNCNYHDYTQDEEIPRDLPEES